MHPLSLGAFLTSSLILLCYRCGINNSQNVNDKPITEELLLDSAGCLINYPEIMKEASIGNGFEYFQSDNGLYLAYMSRRDSSFIVRGVFDNAHRYEMNISEIIPLRNDKDGLEIPTVFAFSNNKFFFFPTPSPAYYTLTFAELKKGGKNLSMVKKKSLSIFDNYAFVSKSPEVSLALSSTMAYFPYKLQNVETNENWIDTTAIILMQNFQSDTPIVKKICKYPISFLKNYEATMINSIFSASEDGMVLYYTNKKSDRITRYDVQKEEEVQFTIPNTHNIDYNDKNKEGIDYSRRFLAQNDINIKLFQDNKGNVFLIRRNPGDEKNKQFEVMYFTKDGVLKSNLILKNLKLNITMSFYFKNEIYIPNAASNCYYTISSGKL